ncbi:hypothetical protein VTK56DRAFT_7653 [Thermocarpiscus australiensis]
MARPGSAGRALALLTASASLAAGQAVWDSNQVNTTICQWQQLRAHVIRDTVYLDGGTLFWQQGFADGTIGAPLPDDNPLGLMYTLNFSNPFNTTQNISAVLGTLQKPTGGGDANNLAPNYFDGALLGNHEELFLYGGLLEPTDAFSDPPGNIVLGYQRYQYGPVRETFRPSFVNRELGANTTRYVAYGGAASAPSENLAWYFSGLRSASGGAIYVVSGANETTDAVNVSSTLITLDMEKQQQETFANHTLPAEVPGRANPELVWVPVGPRGILVALGGVVYPDFANYTGESVNEEASRAQSPSFMSTIDIYDVASGNWYRQRTTGGPGQLTRGCAVVAPAQDGSSFNIYYYGGYDGLHMAQPYSDDVWVLSLPSFTWVKLASSAQEGRAGHKCVMPYPDQMLVIGGYPSLGGAVISCLAETIRVFNLSTGTWLDRYDPAVWSRYTVPSAVREKIGGSGTGGAMATTPNPSGWDSDGLASVFATPYATSKITTYYPYPSVGPTDNTNPSVPIPTPAPDDGGGVPSYLAPVLGSVLGLVFLTVVALLIFLWRRRKVLRGDPSEAETEDTNGHRIKSWLRGQPSEAKAPTVTTATDYMPLSATDVETTGVPPARPIPEMMDTEVQRPAELPAPPPIAELQDTGLTYMEVLNRSGGGAVANGSSYYSNGGQQIDHASTISRSSPSPHPPPPPAPPDESPVYYRPDSDALGNPPPLTSSAGTSPTDTTATNTATNNTATRRSNVVLSGVSNLSERDRAHLRQISDTTVSSVTTAAAGNRISDGGGGGGGAGATLAGHDNNNNNSNRLVESPAVVSPPTAGPAAEEGEGGDSFSARQIAQQRQGQGQGQGQGGTHTPRRSVFFERREDMNGDGDGHGGEKSG